MSADGRRRPVPDTGDAERADDVEFDGADRRFTTVLTRITATLAFTTLIAAAVVPVMLLRQSPQQSPGGGPPAVGAMHAAAATDQVRGRQWYLSSLRVPRAWRWGRGKNVTVAVLDTGVDGRHKDLTGQVVAGPDYTGRTRRPGGRYWGGHGTAMAGIIAGHGNGPGASAGIMGIAPEAKILSIRVTWENDDPLRRNNALAGRNRDAVARGIRYAVDNGADIINMSLGGGRAYYNGNPTEEAAIQYALSKGVVLIASAGNDGTGANRKNFPAAYPGVIAVGAVDRRRQPWPDTNRNSYVSVCAPGVNIISAAPGDRYVLGTGTSPSSAVVAGVAALIRSRYPQLTPQQVREALIRGSVRRPGAAGVCARSLDAVRAVYAAHQINNAAGGATPGAAAATRSPAPAAEPADEEPNVVLWSILGGGALLVVLGVALGWRQRRRSEEVGAEPPPLPEPPPEPVPAMTAGPVAGARHGAVPQDTPVWPVPAEPAGQGDAEPGRAVPDPRPAVEEPPSPPWAEGLLPEPTGKEPEPAAAATTWTPPPPSGNGNGNGHRPVEMDDLRPFTPPADEVPAVPGAFGRGANGTPDAGPAGLDDGTGLPPADLPSGARGGAFTARLDDDDPLGTGFGRFGTTAHRSDPPARKDQHGPSEGVAESRATQPEESRPAPADVPQVDPGSVTAPFHMVGDEQRAWQSEAPSPEDELSAAGHLLPPDEGLATEAFPAVSSPADEPDEFGVRPRSSDDDHRPPWF